jgi:hypothetical protein
MSLERQILLDESLQWLAIYDDPDPGIYDPPPPTGTLLLAEYAMRAKSLNDLLRERIEAGDGKDASPATISSFRQYSQTVTASDRHTSIQLDEGAIAMKREKVFVSYSHADKKMFEEFKKMLAPAIREGIVDIWDDKKIVPGAMWKKEIEDALQSAKIAVLLVSPNFLASDFIAKHELPPLLKAAQDEGVKIFWIYLDYCLYEKTQIAGYHAAHDVSRPLSALSKSERGAVISRVCHELIELVENPK